MEQYSSEHEQDMIRLYASLSEKDRRRYAAVEAKKLGHGGIKYICSLFGCDDKTVSKGILELNDDEALSQQSIRKPGGGRKRCIDSEKGLNEEFLEVLKDHTAGDPMNDKVKWTNLSPSEIATELKKKALK